MQKVCIKVVTHLHQFSGKVPFLHWVSRIAVNTCLNQIRHEKHRPEVRLADLGEEEAGVVEHLATMPGELNASEQVAARDLVEKLLQGLRPDDRLLVRLMYLEGHAVAAISGLDRLERRVDQGARLPSPGAVAETVRGADEGESMNPLDDQLDRLLRAARGTENSAVFAPPFGLETRVLAAWRGAGPGGLWNTGLLVRGLLLASAIMALCLWPALTEKSTPDSEVLQLADSTLQVDNL